MFKPDKTNGFEVQSEGTARAEAAKYKPKKMSAKARYVCTVCTVRMHNMHIHMYVVICNLCYHVEYLPSRADMPEYGDILRLPEVRKADCKLDEDSNYAVFISYVEIYNNYVFDLLDESPTECKK